jgi:hypothetical protein
MKTGLTLVDLATQLTEVKRTAKDFVADTRKLAMTPDAKSIVIAGQPKPFELTTHARRQLADKVGIPVPFFDRLAGKHPDLLKATVDALFQREPGQHMVRTIPGAVRAVVSNGYRPLDNYDLADAVLPVLKKAGAQITSCNLSETQMYIKALCPWLDRELEIPEGLKMGVGHNFFVRKVIGALTIRGSDVGAGSVQLLPGIFEEQCTNLATFRTDGLVKVHLGKRVTVEESVEEFVSDSTRRLDDAAFWSLVRDQVTAMTDGKIFAKVTDRMIEARGKKITKAPADVVEVFGKKNGLTKDETGGLLRHLVDSGEMTQYGLQWAVTRLAADVADYDRATEFEKLGGAVIELPANDWKVLAEAA